MMYSTSSRVILVPAYLSVMTLSPGFTVMVTGLPSTMPPGPTAMTSATEGFSLAEPVRIIPPLVVSSASVIFKTTRSESGVSFIVVFLLISFLLNKFSVSTQNTGVLTLIIIPHLYRFSRGILENHKKFTFAPQRERLPGRWHCRSSHRGRRNSAFYPPDGYGRGRW